MICPKVEKNNRSNRNRKNKSTNDLLYIVILILYHPGAKASEPKSSTRGASKKSQMTSQSRSIMQGV